MNLAHHLKRPFLEARNMSGVKLESTVTQLNQFMKHDTNSDRVPEHDAVNFYLLNHAFSIIRAKRMEHEPLAAGEAEIANTYFTELSEATARAFYYMLLICTRESRHNKAYDSFSAKLKGKYGVEIHNFWEGIQHTGSSATASALRDNPPNCTLGQYTESLVYHFYKGQYGGGYGGPAWGAIANCLHNFVLGKYTAEMMMDTVWTLSHNNGPIFNKGMLYSMYSSDLKVILDVQRGGMVPQLVGDTMKGVHYVSQERLNDRHRELFLKIQSVYPEEFGGFTDWYLIEELGALGKCHHHKKKQKAAFGLSEKHAAMVAAAEAKKQAIAEAKKQMAEQESKKWFHVTPTQKVKLVTRAELNAATA